jgi:hypothetical protein
MPVGRGSLRARVSLRSTAMDTGRERVTVLSSEQCAAFPRHPILFEHHLPAERLASDEGLARLLDRMPAGRVEAFTMGDDPERREDWRFGTHAGLSGRELLDAVVRGRLWLNVLRVEEVDNEIATLVGAVMAEVGARLLGSPPLRTTATLLVSSPTAQVYFHADGQPNLLWHLRGTKRVWVYPALDEHLVARSAMEQVFSGERDEELPYRRDFDERADVFDLHPGHVLAWPQNAPHRVVNTAGLNVSLSTEYVTPSTLRREHVWSANRYLRKRAHLPLSSVRENGLGALVKTGLYRGCRRLRPPAPDTRRRTPSFRVDPEADSGFVDMQHQEPA